MTQAPFAQWGEHLRTARVERGLSLNKLAQLADIDQSYLSRVERGEYGVSDEARIRIAKALGVRVEDIWVYPETRAAS